MPNGSENFCQVGRLTVPRDVVDILFELESNGLSLEPDGDYLLVRPSGVLTDEQRVRVKRWKHHILAIIAERAKVVH